MYVVLVKVLLEKRIQCTFPNPSKAAHMGMIACIKPWHPELCESLVRNRDCQSSREGETIKESKLIQEMWQDLVRAGGSCHCMDCLNKASTTLNGFACVVLERLSGWGHAASFQTPNDKARWLTFGKLVTVSWWYGWCVQLSQSESLQGWSSASGTKGFPSSLL